MAVLRNAEGRSGRVHFNFEMHLFFVGQDNFDFGPSVAELRLFYFWPAF